MEAKLSSLVHTVSTKDKRILRPSRTLTSLSSFIQECNQSSHMMSIHFIDEYLDISLQAVRVITNRHSNGLEHFKFALVLLHIQYAISQTRISSHYTVHTI